MLETELSSSLEDYLETIFLIIRERQAVRSKDIADHMGVTTASVSAALKALSERRLVNHEPYGVITLTEDGHALGSELLRAHEALRDFLTKVLAVQPTIADETACRMEHTIPGDVLDRFLQFIEFIETCPHSGAAWIEGHGFHCKDEGQLERCERCVNEELDVIRKHRLRSLGAVR